MKNEKNTQSLRVGRPAMEHGGVDSVVLELGSGIFVRIYVQYATFYKDFQIELSLEPPNE